MIPARSRVFCHLFPMVVTNMAEYGPGRDEPGSQTGLTDSQVTAEITRMGDPDPAAAAIRDSLAKIVATPLFAGSERLSQFLRFVVEETLEGRGDRIKDYVIGVEVYRKDSSWDPRTDSSVRVEAARLRNKLARYYETEGRNEAIVISVPKGS